ncbi:hypothetical protein BD289DRAFT_379682 [Coniella lustricola]|uniref:Helix-turn-helix-domain containing protein type n=1 Tax=Coniella lustricola TaxID=2025994 RepID=A0A2T2ZSD8_9PEZI|nr:hypothetical protein BD289DRAFT_379682 [Coniella lustricola]
MSTYEIVAPLFISGLQTYDHILSQAETFAKEKGLNVDETFFEARLIDDQLPLKFQVQNTTSLAQINIGRLIGEEVTPFDKDETTVADLRKRVQKTLEWLKSVDASKAANKEGESVSLPALGNTHQVPAKVAVLTHGLPNYFFHLNAGYAILRSKGVPLGKKDYLTTFLTFA